MVAKGYEGEGEFAKKLRSQNNQIALNSYWKREYDKRSRAPRKRSKFSRNWPRSLWMALNEKISIHFFIVVFRFHDFI